MKALKVFVIDSCSDGGFLHNEIWNVFSSEQAAKQALPFLFDGDTIHDGWRMTEVVVCNEKNVPIMVDDDQSLTTLIELKEKWDRSADTTMDHIASLHRELAIRFVALEEKDKRIKQLIEDVKRLRYKLGLTTTGAL